MSFPGLVSQVTVGESVLSIQTESDDRSIITIVFLDGESVFKLRSDAKDSGDLMGLIRGARRQHRSVEARCLTGEFSPKRP